MQVNVEKLSPVLLEFQVQVPADRVKSEVEKAYAVIQRTARVRGFRPGKAPRHVLAHLYGGRVCADVAQRLVDDTLHQALATQHVEPLSQPAIAPTELKPEEAFTYKARFEVRPEVTDVRWEGLEVKRPSSVATDAMVDEEIARLRREHSTLQAPASERPAQTGDVATITFVLDVEGAPRNEGKPQEIETDLGTGQMFTELDEGIVGLKVGEHKDIPVVFPDRHNNPELRGKNVVFHVTLKDVRERILPSIDDEFAKDCGEDSLDKLRQASREKIEKDLKQRAGDVVAQQLVVELCKANPIPVPPSLVQQQAQVTEREVLSAARRQGQRLEVTPELRARVHAESEMKVRAGLAMAEIARAKGINVTEEDIEKGYVELAEQTGKNVAKVKAEYREPKKREMLIGMILEDKILDLIESAAKVSEG